MGSVEIDRGNVRRTGRQIAHHIASAGGDDDHSAVAVDFERFEIDDRILPDLGIDEIAEHHGEEPLLQALPRHRAMAVDGAADELFRAGEGLVSPRKRGRNGVHIRLRIARARGLGSRLQAAATSTSRPAAASARCRVIASQSITTSSPEWVSAIAVQLSTQSPVFM